MRTMMSRVIPRLVGAAALAALAVGSEVVVHAAEHSPQSVVSAEPDWGAPIAAMLTESATTEEPDWG
ncbi:hypothetical protein V1460_25300 [Streptomyces sp. SCSIO 30461]|uniref:hypothetical protein n=1 Tax=Streptomyces sp. SCSIO 30461 TaxID=3118085 RepID=UPI0030CA5C23